jgi:hypothetical protein
VRGIIDMHNAMNKGLAITQEASIDQVRVAKLDNFYRKRSTLVTGTDAALTPLIFIFHVRYVHGRKTRRWE